MDSIFRRIIAIALLGLIAPFLLGWLPTPALITVIECILGAGLIAIPIMMVVFVVQTLVGGATASSRPRY